MQKKINISIKNQYFLLGLLIITVPFLEFVKSNYYLMTKSLLLNVSTYFFIIFFFYSIFYYVLKKTIPLDQNRIKYVLSFSVLFLLLVLKSFLYNLKALRHLCYESCIVVFENSDLIDKARICL